MENYEFSTIQNSFTLRNPVDRDPVVELYNVLNPSQVQELHILAECVKHFIPDHFEDRQFETHGDNYGGGNNVTFLAGYINAIFPDIRESLVRAADAGAHLARWTPYEFPSAFDIGIRCVEYLTYQAGGQLGFHEDKESIYTLIVMLGDPADFTGGEFMIQKEENNEIVVLSLVPQHYGGLVFLSEVSHGVNRILSGRRNVLAVEFWPHEDSDINTTRPSKIRYEDENNNNNTETIKDEQPVEQHHEQHEQLNQKEEL